MSQQERNWNACFAEVKHLKFILYIKGKFKNKKHSQLKVSQKEETAEWLFQGPKDYYIDNGKYPTGEKLYEIVDVAYDKIEAAGIWVPYEEVVKHYQSKLSAIKKRIEKSQGNE